jgi:hypothetical protein
MRPDQRVDKKMESKIEPGHLSYYKGNRKTFTKNSWLEVTLLKTF